MMGNTAASLCEETISFGYRLSICFSDPRKFSKKYAAFLDFVLSCIYCTIIVQVHVNRKFAMFSK